MVPCTWQNWVKHTTRAQWLQARAAVNKRVMDKYPGGNPVMTWCSWDTRRNTGLFDAEARRERVANRLLTKLRQNLIKL